MKRRLLDARSRDHSKILLNYIKVSRPQIKPRFNNIQGFFGRLLMGIIQAKMLWRGDTLWRRCKKNNEELENILCNLIEQIVA
jgi:hypothetical protein